MRWNDGCRGLLAALALSHACASDDASGPNAGSGAPMAAAGSSASQSDAARPVANGAGAGGGSGSHLAATGGASGWDGGRAGQSWAPGVDGGGDSDDGRDASAGEDASEPIDARVRTGLDGLLCDGKPGITFAGAQMPGGLINPSMRLTAENGYMFVIVEGTCRYWVQRRGFDRVVTGSLSDADLQQLRADLQLERFVDFVGDYLDSGGDQPTYFYVLGRGGLTMPCMATADGGGCIGSGNQVPREDLGPLHSALLQTIDRLSKQGSRFDADVRYLLVRGVGLSSDDLWRMPAPWPLGDPEDFAIDQDAFQSYERGTSRRATAADAAALHELWRQLDAREISGRSPTSPNAGALVLPVEVGGTRYQLILRDSVPLEDAHGLIAY